MHDKRGEEEVEESESAAAAAQWIVVVPQNKMKRYNITVHRHASCTEENMITRSLRALEFG